MATKPLRLTKALRSLKRGGEHQPKLRKSIAPGKVLILLTGKHRGARVICLKQLKSGLLLVTGPYKINGVPVMRVTPSHVIATSSKIDLPQEVVTATADIQDAYFKQFKLDNKQSKGKFIGSEKQKEVVKVHPGRVALQKTVDTPIISAVLAQGKIFAKYLASPFSIKKGQFPHLLKF